VVNANADAFVRVGYEAALLQRLTGHALAGLSTVERYALVDDAWASVVAGELSAAQFCTFARGFGDETDLAVWQVLTGALRWCHRFVTGAAREGLESFVRALVGPALARLGWEPGPDEDQLTAELRRVLVLAQAILGQDPSAQRRARELHVAAEADPEAVSPELTLAALSVVASTGYAADHDRLVARFREEDNPGVKLRYLYALADFPDAEQVRATVELAFSGEVRSQNAPFLLGRCIANSEHGAMAWKTVRERWDDANARFPDNSIVRMVDPVKTLTRPEEQADVAGFFAEHPIPQSARTLSQILERQEVNVALRERAATSLADDLLA
jgi:puromycin-sensitive aminopeptidase